MSFKNNVSLITFLTKKKKLTINYTNLSFMLSLVGLLLFLYFIWEVYWMSKHGVEAIRLHTKIMVYVYIWYFGLITFLYFKIFSKEAFLAFSSVVFSLLFIELILNLLNVNLTYFEKKGFPYRSPFKVIVDGHYQSWKPEEEHYLTTPEYSFWRPANSLGFPDIEWDLKKPENQTRVLVLGDSFTEGDGAPFDSTYVAFLRNYFGELDSNIYFMNAGVCGSDPFNNFINLKDLLIDYKPDKIIQAVSSTDLIADIVSRGGFERFLENGKQKYKNAPWWEPIYAISNFSRGFFHLLGYNEQLIKDELSEKVNNELNNLLIELFDNYIEYCNQHNIQLTIYLRPDKMEIVSEEYSFNFNRFTEYISKQDGVMFFDLLPCFKSKIEERGTSIDEYFWVYDGHNNSKGYQLMAECIFENTREQILNKEKSHSDEY